MRTAVIMAAGLGSRFGELTVEMPKGFVQCGGMSMIERSILTLLDCGITRIIIGTGHMKECFETMRDKYPQIECVFSPKYAETNSMYTLWNCRDVVGKEDFLLLESDLIYEKRAITALMECEEPDVMLITPVTKFQDQYYVEHDGLGRLVNCSTDESQIIPAGELVGIHKLSNEFYRIMCEDYEMKISDYPKLGYEYELLHISRTIRSMFVLKEDGLKWYEIDDIDDLKYAEKKVLPYL